MRTTVTIDDDLFKSAQEMADPRMNAAEVIREAVKTFVEVEAARRLAALGGCSPDMEYIQRGRGDDDE